MTIPWSRWLSRLKQGRGEGVARKRPRTVPCLEALEDRMVPSSMLTVNTTMDTNAVNAAVSALDSSGNISLRSAIERANVEGGDTITTPAGDYQLSLGALSITNSVTIEGAGAATTLIDAQQMDRVITVASGAGTVTLQGLTLENGKAPAGDFTGGNTGGGAILDEGATNLNIDHSVLTNNTAQGAVSISEGSVPARAGEGGAVYQYGGTLTFTDSTVSNNKAQGGADPLAYGGGLGAGGGVYTVLGNLVVQSSTFSDNQADGGASSELEGAGNNGQGGAIDYAASQSGVDLTVTDSTFNGNQAQGGANTFGGGEGIGGAGLGGAFYDATNASITDSTIAGNMAMGGVVSEPAGVIQPASPIVANGVGGGFFFSGGEGVTVSIGGTIIATNTASGVMPTVGVDPQIPIARGPDAFTTDPTNAKFTSLGNNLIGVNDQTTDGFANGTDNDQVGGTTALTGIDPMLGTLKDNGGPTETLAITAASPAHNAGAAFGLTADQRGFARTIAGLTDIGAFELDVTPPTATLNAANNVGPSGSGANTTTVVVTYSSTDSGVDPASFGTGNLTVNNGATVTGFSVAGDVVTYTVTAPDSTWANSPQGTYTISLTAGSVTNLDGTGIVGVPDFGNFTVTAVPKFFAVAAGSGSSQVNVYNASTGALMTSFEAFGPGVSGVSVAVGDVTGDGVQDIVVGAGPGNAPDVEIIDGTKLNQIDEMGQIEFSALVGGRDFFAFTTSDPTGVNVAVGRVNRLLQPGVGTVADTRIDAPLDVILGAGAGGGPVVEVIDATKLLSGGGQLNIDPTTHQIEFGALIGGRDFFAYAPTFTGGVTVAAGDVNGDGHDDVIVGAGPGGKSEIKVVNGALVDQIASRIDGSNEITAGALLSDFFAFTPGFTGGVTVGFGTTATGTRELVAAAEAGGGPDIEVIDASRINGFVGATPVPFGDLIGGHDFFAYDSGFSNGVSVAVEDVNGDGFPDIIAAPGQGGSPQQVEVIDGSKIAQAAAADQVAPADLVFAGFFPFGPLFSGGVAAGAVVR